MRVPTFRYQNPAIAQSGHVPVRITRCYPRFLKLDLEIAATVSDLVLLCFEDVRLPGDWCHTLVVEWWEHHTREAVEELAVPDPPKPQKK